MHANTALNLSKSSDAWDAILGKQRFAICQALWVLVLLVLLYWFVDFNARVQQLHGVNSWFSADPMAFSGFLTVIIGVAYSVLVDRNQMAVVYSWQELAIFEVDEAIKNELERELVRMSFLWQCSIGVLVCLLMIVGYASVFPLSGLLSEFSLASFVCGLIVGVRLGRLASHGFLGRVLERRAAKFHIFVEHPDLTGGAAKVGAFYLIQASVVTIPIIWLVLWIVLFPYHSQYAVWGEHFFNLIFLGFCIFFLTFFLPMRSFRRLIRNWKRVHLRREIEAVRSELHDLSDLLLTDARQQARRRELVLYLHQLSSLPSFPVSPLTRNIFVTTLVLPMAVNIATSFVK